MFRNFSVIYLLHFFLIVIFLSFSFISVADTLLVGTGQDYATIADAIAAAGDGAGDVIRVMDPVHTEAGINVNKSVTIEGLGMNETIVQAHPVENMATDRVFRIASGKTVVICDMTIRHGYLNGSGSDEGGGIYNSGDLTLRGIRVTDNHVLGKELVGLSAHGGGIANKGTLYARKCVIAGNSARGGDNPGLCGIGRGGGLYHSNADTILEDCVISGNHTSVANSGSPENMVSLGGGLAFNDGRAALSGCVITNNAIFLNEGRGASFGGGLFAMDGEIQIIDSEISDNSAREGGALFSSDEDITFKNSTISGNAADKGGGVFHEYQGVIQIFNTTIAGNSATKYAGGLHFAGKCSVYVGGSIMADNSAPSHPDYYIFSTKDTSFNSNGYNLVENDTYGNFTGSGDITSVDPMLEGLAWNGGPTRTCALLSGSPCIDVVPTGDLLTDQRGAMRPLDGDGDGILMGDMGAFEKNAFTHIASVPAALDFGDVNIWRGASKPGTISLRNISDNEISLDAITLTGDPEFSVYEQPDSTDMKTSDTREILIEFDPDAPGPYTADLTVTCSGLDKNMIQVPISGNGYNTPPEAGLLMDGAALDFQNADHRMVVTDFNDFPTTAVTVSLWIKSDQASAAGILSYAVPGDHDNEFLLFDQNSLQIFIGDNILYTGLDFADGDWHHLAVTWQSSDGKIILYKDGVPVFSEIHQVGYSLMPDGMFVLAEEQDAPGFYDPAQAFIGQIDEVRIWNQVRSQEEISSAMNQELFGIPADMSGYWKLNEGSGAYAKDMSPSANHGNLKNNTPWIIPGAIQGLISTVNIFTDEDTDTTVTLGGFDADGNDLEAIVTELPPVGNLYQYAGPGPVKGVKIENPDTLVTDSEMRLVYSPENRAADYETSFFWKVFDGLDYSDNPASVTLHVACDVDGDEPPILVDENAPGPIHDGRTWQTAYLTIQEAINDTDAAVLPVYIADGVYEECIVMKSGRKLFGGFEGYGGAEETSLNQRNWRKNITIIDATELPSPNHVVYMESLTNTVLDGLMITGGNASTGVTDAVPENRGGGIYMAFCDKSNLVRNCSISHNESIVEGGNLYCLSSETVFENCLIMRGESSLRGGAVFLDQSKVTFSRCDLSYSQSYTGGSVYFAAGSDAVFENCIFSQNLTFQGIMYIVHSSPVFTNCTFADTFLFSDLAPTGGILLAIGSNAIFRNCIFSGIPKMAVYEYEILSDPVVENCLFFGNTDGDYYDENSVVISGASQINALINYNGLANSGNINGAPHFAAPHYGDYHITACSAALDRATSSGAPDVDRDGLSRPVDLAGTGEDGPGNGYDIGVYELQEGPVLSLTPPERRFADYPVNYPPMSALDAAISNIGTEILHINSLSIQGSADFNVYNPGGVNSLDPCTSHAFFITFDPSSTGFQTANLVVDSNDPESSEKGIRLSGSGYNTPPRAGSLRNAGDLVFSDADDRMMVTDYKDFPRTNITVSFWMKTAGANDAGIFSYAAGEGPATNEFLIYNQNNITIFIHGLSWTTGIPLNDGAWHHLAVSWRRSDGAIRLYKDGSYVTSSTLQAGYGLMDGGTLVLAEDQDAFGGGFDPAQAFIGSLADIRVWNYARSDAEISSDYKRILHGWTPGLVGCWHIGEQAGTLERDSSRSMNHGVIQNGATRLIPGTAPLETLVTDFPAYTTEDISKLLKLHYHDAENDICTVTVKDLPNHGTLYQYAGPVLKKGDMIDSPDTVVTDPENQVIYVPGLTGIPNIDHFSWDVYDGYAGSENRAFYHIHVTVPPRKGWMLY